MKLDYIGYAIALITFVIGLIVSYYFYVRSLRNKEPIYLINNTKIMTGYESTIPNLKVTYNNKKIKSLSVAEILFYNRGAETITKQDIDTINHIRITANKDVKILDASVVQLNNPSSLLAVELNNNQALINFDYLDRNQGAVIKVMHTGLSKEDIKLVGDIKGVNDVVEIERENRFGIRLRSFLFGERKYYRTVMKIMIYVLLLVFAYSLISTIYSIVSPQEYKLLMDAFSNNISYQYMNLGLLAFLFPMLYIMIVVTRSIIGQSKTTPHGLEMFDEN